MQLPAALYLPFKTLGLGPAPFQIASLPSSLGGINLRQAVLHAPAAYIGSLVVTPQEEDLLWSTETIGTSSPLSLQRAVFYYVGKVFCLRGGEEQRSLKISQFKREEDSYVYVENGSKNCSGTSTRILL